jgi:carboxymethylenebutenolidase
MWRFINSARAGVSACSALVCVLGMIATVTCAETKSLKVGVRQNMSATLVTPGSAGPYPGILLLHTSGGLEQADIAFANQLAQVGYVVLVPSFLDAYGISARTRQLTFTADAEPIYADLVAALNTLSHEPGVGGRKIGAIGFSNGGYFAMWLAATGKVHAGVSYYGALSGAGTDREQARFSSIFSKSSSPVLILHGTDDSTVPVGVAKRLAAIADSAGGRCEIHLYEGAGHLFDRDGGSSNRAAATDAWQRTLDFLGKYLASAP